MDSYRRAEDRRRHAFCRAAAKEILASYLETPPPFSRDFAYGVHGKPEWSGPAFNIAHSGAMAAVAVAPGHAAVGVDIEFLAASGRDFQGIAEQFLPEERALLRGLAGDALGSAFYRMWVVKEAVMKATGEGLFLGLDRVRIPVSPEREWSEVLDGEGRRVSRWWTPVRGFGEFLVAVAAERAVSVTSRRFVIPRGMVIQTQKSSKDSTKNKIK